MTNQHTTRRDLLKLAAFGLLGSSACGWLEVVANRARAAEQATKKLAKSCVVIFLNGGPAQTFTLDMKPKTGKLPCPYEPIDTTIPGVQVCEHLPLFAQQMNEWALVRSMSTAIADHAPARYLMRTGFRPAAGLTHPSFGARVAHELVREDVGMPNYVLLGKVGLEGVGAGFLPPSSRPLILRDVAAGLANLTPHTWLSGGMDGVRERTQLLDQVDGEFAAEYQAEIANIKRAGYRKAVELMDLDRARTAFQIDNEPETIQEAYGKTPFGRFCLGARRLLEHGVKYVEVVHPENWDTHNNAVPDVAKNCGILDRPVTALIQDLRQCGMLDDTLVVLMGEFGRDYFGANHHAQAWTTAFAGGGVRGGQVIGRTDDKGMTVEDRPVKVQDFAATIYSALGIDSTKETDVRNRPIRSVDGESKPLLELFS